MNRITAVTCHVLTSFMIFSAFYSECYSQSRRASKEVQVAAPTRKSLPEFTQRTRQLTTAEEVFDRFAQVVGVEAYRKVTTAQMTARIEYPEAKYESDYTVSFKAPYMFASREYYEQHDLYSSYAFDGTKMMQQAFMPSTSQISTKDVPVDDLEGTRRDSDFYYEIKLKELFPRSKLRGVEESEDGKAYVVETIVNSKLKKVWYFDVETGLLSRRDDEHDTPEGRFVSKKFYDDYRRVEPGIMYAHSNTSFAHIPENNKITTYTTVRFGVPIADKEFDFRSR